MACGVRAVRRRSHGILPAIDAGEYHRCYKCETEVFQHTISLASSRYKNNAPSPLFIIVYHTIILITVQTPDLRCCDCSKQAARGYMKALMVMPSFLLLSHTHSNGRLGAVDSYGNNNIPTYSDSRITVTGKPRLVSEALPHHAIPMQQISRC